MSRVVKELLISKGFWVLNKEVVKKIGIEPALILSVFSEADDMLADEEGWFYQTAPTIQELTGMTNHKQTKAIEKLIELEIVSQQNRGLPCKRYFKINYEKVENLVFKNFENCNLKNLKTGIEKISNNKEHNINNIDKENNNKVVVDDFVETEDMRKRRIEVTKFKEEMSFKLREKNLNVKVEDLLKYAGGDIELIKRQFEHFADKGAPLLVASIKGKYEPPKQVVEKKVKVSIAGMV